MTSRGCPHCGSVLLPGVEAVVCPECGKPLGDASPTTPMGPETTPMDGGVREFTDVPERIGPYKILEQIGEGGMGAVYLAEQHEPVHRKVALKLIKAGMDTGQFVARFESERQALALMNHATIAKVLDGGATPQGRPYFVMEFIDGVPITQYCDNHKLGMRERLDLFLSVCDGVQHAHQKGIIHRDLKPSNVLVEVQDGTPVPKIIDFGVAKATDQHLTERTLYTDLGMMVGTPEYMSPEQADMTGLDIDTRTDVYSLGVLLYELLTGSLPFTTQELREAGFEGMRQKIREEDPPKPSTRVSRLGGDTEVVAANRGLHTGELSRRLRGDLDWITVRSMEKDRGRRYGSPADLAADLKRYLTDEPVEASPPSRAYRTRKFVRRHKMGVIAASLVTLAVILGMVGTTVGLVRARKAEAVAKEAEQVATDEAAAANEVSDFLVGLFEQANPWEAQSDTMRVRDVLDRGAERIETTLEDQPLLKARMLSAIGNAYESLGLGPRAATAREEALALREANLDPEDPLVAASLYEFARSAHGGTKEQRAKALELGNRALTIQRKVLPPDHPDLAETLYGFGSYYSIWRGLQEQGVPFLREALSIADMNGDAEMQARVLQQLSWNRLVQGLNLLELPEPVKGIEGDEAKADSVLAEAEELLHRAIDKKRALGSDISELRGWLGRLYFFTNRPEKALAEFLPALEGVEEIVGPDHPVLGGFFRQINQTYEWLGESEQALEFAERAMSLDQRLNGEDSKEAARSMIRVSGIQSRRGRADLALPLFQHATGSLGWFDSPVTEESSRSTWSEFLEFFKYGGLDVSPINMEDLSSMKELTRRGGLGHRASDLDWAAYVWGSGNRFTTVGDSLRNE